MKRGAIEKLLLLGDKGLAARYASIARHKAVQNARHLVHPGQVLNDYLKFRNGWAKIQVRDGRRRIIIYAEGGGLSYEFFTSELIEPYYVYTPPYDGTPAFSVCGKGSFHEFKGGWKDEPLVDLCHNCADTGPPDPGEEALSYPLMSCETNVGLENMKSPDAWDILKFQKQLWFQGWRGEKFVTCGLDVVPYNKRNQMVSWINARVDDLPGGGYGWRLFANGFAEAPNVWVWDQYEPVATGGPTRGASEYFYGGCVRNSGNHEVVIMVNGDGKFYAWEAGDYSATPPTRVESVTPSYDTVIETGFSTFQFNSDGTKAVATCIEYRQSRKDEDSNDVYKALQGTFLGLDYGSGNVGAAYGGSKRLAQEDLPLLVEVEIDVWEDTDGNWQFSVTLTKETKYDTLQEWIIAADYIEDVPGFERGTLVALFNELYYETSYGYLIGATPHFPEDFNIRVSRAIVFKSYDPILDQWDEIRRIPMTTGLLQFIQPTAINDPYGNQQVGFGFANITAGSGLRDLHDAQINALNLKTLSWSIYKFQRLNPNGQTTATEANGQRLEVWAYNQLEKAEELIDDTHGPMAFDFPWPVSGHSKLPYNLYEVMAGNAASMFEPKYRGQFSWHPKGHWSINNVILPIPYFQDQFNGEYFMLDVVKLADGQTFTHQDLYNSAFSDTRQVSYYNDNDDYRGVFKTAGIWRDK